MVYIIFTCRVSAGGKRKAEPLLQVSVWFVNLTERSGNDKTPSWDRQALTNGWTEPKTREKRTKLPISAIPYHFLFSGQAVLEKGLL